MAKQLGRDQEIADRLQDPFLRRSVKTALHLRKYLPFYVFGTLWAVTLAAFPSINPSNDADTNVASTEIDSGSSTLVDDGTASTTDAAGTGTGTDPTGTASGGTVATSGGTAGGSTARTGTANAATVVGGEAGAGAAITVEAAQEAIQRGTGKTRLGFDCTPERDQLPGSSYSVPCQNVYDGPNGGATYRGVTDKEIVLVRRKFPESANSRAVAAVVQQAGGADPAVTDKVRLEFVKYFNKTFELYGRQVKFVEWEAKNGNSTDEAQSKGKEKACLDADVVAKEIKAFAVASGSSPFSECAAERKLMVFDAGAYYPETWFKKYHPYLWGGPMECERISYQLAEYVGKRLINKPAKWAGDPTGIMQRTNRYFGTYVPDNDGYQQCVKITKSELQSKYGVKDTGPQYNYVLDVSRFPDQAAQATVDFASTGVTTVILACDAISAIVLTEAATKQKWYPEWMTIGTGLTDLDNAARLYDQVQANGHLYGPSQLGSADKLIGAKSEPGAIYKQATGNTIPEGTSGDYFQLVRIWSMLQAAGPVLNPQTIAQGVMTMPPRGAPHFPAGYASFLDKPDGSPADPGQVGDHTAVDDSREVFWVNPGGNKSSDKSACPKNPDPYYNSADGCEGTYKETYNGQRFRNGEWPKEDPPIYPPH